MKIIGLTGSIAAGKSTAARMCIQLGFWVHDADATVHQLLGPYGQAVPAVLACFGDVGTLANGIDRKNLGQIVFSAPQKRKILENILHPLVYQERENFVAQARRHHQRAIILDVPLLFETGGDENCDAVICVWASDALRRQRALQRAAMTPQKFRDINAAQLSQAQKKRRADLWLATGQGKAYTRRQLTKYFVQQGLR